MSGARRRSQFLARLACAAALGVAVWLGITAAQAQNATWNGSTTDWNTATNWTPNTVPTGTASFTNTGSTTVDNSSGFVSIGAIAFTAAPNAQAYTINIDSTFIINGAGVQNNSTNTQTFNVDPLGNAVPLIFQNASTANSGTGAVTYNNYFFIFFENTSNAGNANTTFVNNEIIEFSNSSSAGSANFTNNVQMDFFDSTTASSANITNASTGTITFNNNATAGTATITNDNGGTINFNNSATAGGASITNDNGGTITFNDTTTAGTAIIGNAGSITFNNSSTAGSATITTSSGGSVVFTGNSTGGSAQFITNGTGSVDFSGTTGPAGNNQISAGSIAGSGTYFLGANQLTVGSNNLSTTVSGVIADGGASGGTGGSLVKVGTGTLTLSGANTYTGSTTISAGTLALSGSGSIATSSGVIDNATFDISGTTSGATITTLSGSGSVALGGRTLTLSNASGTFSGVIFGTGGALVQTAGTETLSGANTYSGGTTLNGGTLVVGNNSALGSGTLAMAAGTTLSFLSTGNFTVANAITIAGDTFFTPPSGTTQTISGVISNGSSAGTLNMTGAGTLVLAGVNTYTGGTEISSGILQVTNNSSVGTGAVTLDGGTFQSGAAGLVFSNAFAINVTGGTVDTQANTLTLSSAISNGNGTTGTLTKIGTGTLILSGTNTYTGGTTISLGTLQVTNNSAVGTGTITLDGGTFQSGAAGLAFNNAFAVNTTGGTIDTQANTLTLSGTIADGNGAGALTKVGSGTLILTGNNTYTGGTTISIGTLQIGNGGTSGSIAGNVIDNGVLAFNRSDTVTFSGVISGSGALQQNGGIASNVILTGNNTYAGGTTISAGTLQLGNGGTSGSIIGNVTDNGNLAFNRSDNITFSGLISGAGTVTQSGPGTLTLPNANTYTGGTFLLGGTIAVGNNNSLGTGTLGMVDGTTLTFTQNGLNLPNAISLGVLAGTIDTGANTETLSGVISGPNDLTKIGSGTLILSANNTYTGPTNVNAGMLDVTGSIASSSLTTVASGAFLIGNGTIGSIQINSGGTFAPGVPGSPGTLTTVSGNLAFQSGAVYLVQLNPSSTTSANVSGTATLTGATVNAQFATGSYMMKQYIILTAAGGLGGTTFAGLTNTNLPAGTSDSLSYTADDVFLNLKPGFTTYTGLNINQQNVANTLTHYFDTTGGIPAAFATLTPGGLTQIDGEVATGAERAAFQLMDEFLQLMLDPFVDGRLGSGVGGVSGKAMGFAPDEQATLPPDIALAYASMLKAPPPAPFAQRWTAWGAAYGGSNTASGDPVVGSSNVSTSTFGFAGGMDYHYSPDTIFGFALAGGGTNWGLANALGTGRSDAFLSGVYGITRSGPAYLAAALAFANHWMITNRSGLGDQLQANFEAQSYGARLEGGYRYAVLPALGVTPYAALQAQAFETPSYSETDVTGGGFGLSYAAMSATDIRSELGARFDDPAVIGGLPLLLRARVAWAHDWVSNPALSAVFETLPGTNFVVNGAPMPQNSALTTVGAELFITPHLTLLAKFDGEFAPGSQTYAGSGTLRYLW